MDLKQYLVNLPQTYLADAAAGIDATVNLTLTDHKPSNYKLTVKDKKATFEEGAATEPTLAVTGSLKDLQDVVDGKLEPMPAFMSGKIQVKGNPLFIAQLVGILQSLKA